MEDLYGDLENYNEVNAIAEVRTFQRQIFCHLLTEHASISFRITNIYLVYVQQSGIYMWILRYNVYLINGNVLLQMRKENNELRFKLKERDSAIEKLQKVSKG